ncbi:MAG: membrane protein insertase YidC [Proteobacteria bacterium]|nr:membrane protein insertase YidC [Pseudomonadota bacterium]
MPSFRSLLLFALAFVALLLWQAWEQDYAPKPVPAPAQATANPAMPPVSSAEVPAATAVAAAAAPVAATTVPRVPEAMPPGAPAPTISITTDVLRLTIDTRGGSVVRADLLDYPADADKKHESVRLFDDAAPTYYVAQSGLVSAAGSGVAPDHQALFHAAQPAYVLAPGADELEVPLSWTGADGLKVTKTYTFTRGSYLIGTRQEIANGGSVTWIGNAYRQLQRVAPPAATGFNNPERYAYVGAAWYSPEHKFNKLAFDKFAKEPLAGDFAGGWVAMLQHYFFSAWIPDKSETDTYSSAVVEMAGAAPRYLVRSLSPSITVAPGQAHRVDAHLYIGPTLLGQLEAIGDAGIAKNLALTADYGMLTPIAQPMHWILLKLHALVRNWGLAIILLVLLIKLVMFKASEAQYRSGAKMKKLAPRLQALKERYGDDKQKLSAATMELYQKEKINPLGGCLPTLIQIPVFFALYYVLLESVELRQAPFFGWIQNLSAPDPYYILPLLNMAVMAGTSLFTPPSPGMDPTQQKMMRFMPIAFSVLFFVFPSGLVLYYAVNGGLGLLQQWIITRRMEAAEAKAAR